MKKAILSLSSALIVVYMILAGLGLGKEYEAEKLFYRAMKKNAKIAVNPDVAPPALLQSIEDDLLRLLKKYPKAGVTKGAGLALAEFYIANKNYDKALSRLDEVMRSYAKDPAMMSMALFLKGVAYERQDKWDKAVEQFTTLKDTYTNTELGLKAPLYIGRHYEIKGDSSQAKKAYTDAALYYDKLRKKHSRKLLGFASSTSLMHTYLKLEEYAKAGTVLKEIVKEYPAPNITLRLLPYVDLIFIAKLNSPDQAIEIYKDVKSKVKSKKITDALQRKIEKLEKKPQNVKI